MSYQGPHKSILCLLVTACLVGVVPEASALERCSYTCEKKKRCYKKRRRVRQRYCKVRKKIRCHKLRFCRSNIHGATICRVNERCIYARSGCSYRMYNKVFKDCKTKKMCARRCRTIPKAVVKAIVAFNQGKFERAKVLFLRAGRHGQVLSVQRFNAQLREGSYAARSRNPARAIPALEEALKLNEKIGLGKSNHTRRIKMLLANMYIFRALSHIRDEEYPAAFQSLVAAKKHKPSHRQLKPTFARLRKVARKYVEQAENSTGQQSKARRLLQRALKMLSRRDSLYHRARRLLKQL